MKTISRQTRLSDGTQRVLVVSNRGPYEHKQLADGSLVAEPSQGGVATALRQSAQYRPTTWLSSPMSAADRLLARLDASGPGRESAANRFVLSDEKAYRLFYDRFSNEVLWFLQHEMAWPADQTAEARLEAWQDGYVPVNQAFAEAVVEELDASGGSTVMLHDYHFYTAPLFVRNLRPEVYLQQFVHIPWPQAVEWSRLEAAIVVSICRSLLANDSLVFQTPESVENFLATCESYLPDVHIDQASGLIDAGSRPTRVTANPISVDPRELSDLAATPAFAGYQEALRAAEGQKLIVRVDRLDPSKNVLAGFQAYRLLLQSRPELRGKVRFLAFLVPTRSDVPAYVEYQRRTLALVDEINAELGSESWTPIEVKFENNRLQALAGLSLADVVLVNPVADGMNLVSKEAPLVNQCDAVLVLSRRAGSYTELSAGALGIEPEDVGATATALQRGLAMEAAERRVRAEKLRERIAAHDLSAWFAGLLGEMQLAGEAEAVA